MLIATEMGLDQREHYPDLSSANPSSPSANHPHAKPWRALIVQPTREFAVLDRLQRYDVSAYLPAVSSLSRWSDRKKTIERALITGYVFARFASQDRATVYSTSPYIYGGLEFGGHLAEVTEQEIAWLRTLVASNLPLSHGEILHRGDRVRISCGKLAGIEGRLLEINGELKLQVEMTLLGRAVHATVTREQVRRA